MCGNGEVDGGREHGVLGYVADVAFELHLC